MNTNNWQPTNDDARGQKRNRSDDANVEESKAPSLRDGAGALGAAVLQSANFSHNLADQLGQQFLMQQPQGQLQSLQGQIQNLQEQLQQSQGQQANVGNALGQGNNPNQNQSMLLNNANANALLAQFALGGRTNAPASGGGGNPGVRGLGGGNFQGNMSPMQQQLGGGGGQSGGNFSSRALSASNPAPALNMQQALQALQTDGNLMRQLLLAQGMSSLQHQQGRPDPPVEANMSAAQFQMGFPFLQGIAPGQVGSGGGVPVQPAAAAAAMAPQAQARPVARRPKHNQSHLVDNSGTKAVLLYVPTDDESISPYQAFARQQIELFEAQDVDVQTGAQGRNKPVQRGQVGIRCIHCSDLHPKLRTRAAVYYPSRLTVLYQAAQNIVNIHLPELCESIPDETRAKLLGLDNKRSSVGGGKNYWSDTAQIQGITDTGNGLRFREEENGNV